LTRGRFVKNTGDWLAMPLLAAVANLDKET
jgi:hypothetical protein